MKRKVFLTNSLRAFLIRVLQDYRRDNGADAEWRDACERLGVKEEVLAGKGWASAAMSLPVGCVGSTAQTNLNGALK